MPADQLTRTGPAVQACIPLHQRTDLDLARAAPQDELAFGELYRRHFQRVYGYHLLRTSNVDDAQDLTSQTFMAALEGIQRFKGQGSFAAWLMSIAHHKMAQHYRRKRPLADLEESEQLPDERQHPEHEALRRGLLRQVRHAMRRITPERAEAFLLRTFGGLSAAETAEVMGKSEGAVKMLAHRALADLRQILGSGRALEEE